MDKRIELVQALLAFGKQAELLAKLLSVDVIGEMRDDTLLIELPNTDQSINVNQFHVWPEANFERPDPAYRAQMNATGIATLSDMTVLEYNAGVSYPISHFHKHSKIDLITDGFKFDTQPPNVRIINSFAEARDQYDMGVVWESLEFSSNPALILTEIKNRCRKVTIRFKPWTSRDGAFQSYHFNKAYAHLLMPVDNKVKFKVIRPLATYESLLAKIGLSVQERKINSIQIEECMASSEFLDVIIARTWGAIRKDEAIRIMMTDSVDYVVGK